MNAVAEDPEILAAIEAARLKGERAEAILAALLVDANRDGLELLALLIQARVMFSAFINGRPGITGQQVHEFIKRADWLLEI